MAYQNVLPFDENYGWFNLIKNAKKLIQSQKIVYYGLKNRKITIRKISRDRFLLTSYSLQAMKYNIIHDKELSFIEVEFMSTVLKPNIKHVHSYRKSLTKNEDWRKQIYNCSNAHCNHYIQAQHILNKAIRCAKCGEDTIGDYEQIRHRNRNLVCLNCSKSTKKKRLNLVQTELEELFSPKAIEEEEEPNIL